MSFAFRGIRLASVYACKCVAILVSYLFEITLVWYIFLSSFFFPCFHGVYILTSFSPVGVCATVYVTTLSQSKAFNQVCTCGTPCTAWLLGCFNLDEWGLRINVGAKMLQGQRLSDLRGRGFGLLLVYIAKASVRWYILKPLAPYRGLTSFILVGTCHDLYVCSFGVPRLDDSKLRKPAISSISK